MTTNDNPESVVQGVRNRAEEWRYEVDAAPYAAWAWASEQVLRRLEGRHPRLGSRLIEPEPNHAKPFDVATVCIRVDAMIEGAPYSAQQRMSVLQIGLIRDLDAVIDRIAKQLIHEMAVAALYGKGDTSEQAR